MAVFVQPSTPEEGGETQYEVFRRSSAPQDQTITVVESKQQAIAVAGRVAEPGETIEEFPEQQDFEFIARGPGADEEIPKPETSDTGGGFLGIRDGVATLFGNPDQSDGDGGGAGDAVAALFEDPEESDRERQGPLDGIFAPPDSGGGGGSSSDGGSGGGQATDPMGDIQRFEDEMLGGRK